MSFRRTHPPRLTLAVALLCLCRVVAADWINLTGAETAPNIAEIYVLEDRVKLVLEVYVGDLELFAELIPDDWIKDERIERPPLAAREERFSERRFQLVTENGEKLHARIDLVEPRRRVDRQSPFAGMINPMTRQPVPEPPADKRVMYAELSYLFSQRPKALTIIPPLDDEGRPQTTIGFIAYHETVPVIDFRYLSTAVTLDLDWNDPWYTKFDNPNLKRHHQSALMSFLYVEPFEVRHEILTRVKDLAAWMDLGLRGDAYIELDELEPLKRRIGEFLLTRNPLRVDGSPAKPILDRTSYVKVGLRGIQLMERPERLRQSTAIVGVIITYLTDGIPDEVTVDWDLFTDQLQRVPATATDPAGPFPSYITPDDNVHTWRNFLKNYQLPTVREVRVVDSLGTIELPWISLLCAAVLPVLIGWGLWRRHRGSPALAPLAGAALLAVAAIAAYPFARVSIARPTALSGALEPERAQDLLQVLLKNVYRAFDFREEEDVYDKLAVTVSGDLLADIYLQNRRSFSIQQAGGAQAKITDVVVEAASAQKVGDRPLAYAIRGRWAAQGTVGHWGHVHTRRNRYDAVVTVEALDGAWKITDLEVLEEQRVDPAAASAPLPPNNAPTDSS